MNAPRDGRDQADEDEHPQSRTVEAERGPLGGDGRTEGFEGRRDRSGAGPGRGTVASDEVRDIEPAARTV